MLKILLVNYFHFCAVPLFFLYFFVSLNRPSSPSHLSYFLYSSVAYVPSFCDYDLWYWYTKVAALNLKVEGAMSYPREPVQQIYFVIYWAQAVPKAVF